MKKLILLTSAIFALSQLSAQVTHTVSKGTGNTFSPASLTVNQGDVVHFALTAPHDVTQVSLETWNANGTTPLAGGFVFSTGSGDYTATSPGTIYYVCTIHVSASQMKGSILVNAVTGINDIHTEVIPKLYPNPANDKITLRADKYSSIEEIRISDLSGKSVKVLSKPTISDDQVNMDIADLKKGIYFISVKTVNGIETEKLLKP
jgi:plastocyanin